MRHRAATGDSDSASCSKMRTNGGALGAVDLEAGASDVLDERRRRHNRIVFERERRDGDLLRRQLQQIVETRACRSEPVGVSRPSELAQQRPRDRRCWDSTAPASPIRPGRRAASRPAAQRRAAAASSSRTPPLPVRGAKVCPSIHRRTVAHELGDRQRPIVVAGVRIAQRGERADDRRARAHLALSRPDRPPGPVASRTCAMNSSTASICATALRAPRDALESAGASASAAAHRRFAGAAPRRGLPGNVPRGARVASAALRLASCSQPPRNFAIPAAGDRAPTSRARDGGSADASDRATSSAATPAAR